MHGFNHGSIQNYEKGEKGTVMSKVKR